MYVRQRSWTEYPIQQTANSITGGYNVKDIIAGIDENSHFGFEECTYLLLFGSSPTKDELKNH